MRLCPHCNKQFEDGFTVCALCGRDLIDYTPLMMREAESPADALDEDVYTAERADLQENEPQMLISVDDRFEADRIKALLEDCHIPCLIKGGTVRSTRLLNEGRLTGFDLYVPAALFQQALDLLHNEEDNDLSDPDDSDGLFDGLVEPGKNECEQKDLPEEDDPSLDASARRIRNLLIGCGTAVAVIGIAVVLIWFFTTH